MTDADPKVEAFFKTAKQWRDELAALRAILHSSQLTEEFKWRSPCYTFQGGNVVAMWGLKASCALAFFKGALMKDPAGILEAPGENSRSMRTIKFAGMAEIESLEGTVRRYVDEAIEVEKSGLRVEFRKDDLEFPDELADRLDADPGLRAAFEALTPGRRRGYVLHFSQPKQSKTRASRIERAVPRILDGKGMHDR
ncbi:YdeI/OmpD-associated family protein [Thalassobaculum sp.]|uniref:YdeI/OmpD-associated family protein n=1 Tax=Thalassobaculum sp. TaxID=2022740 RepID=UPI0032ECAAC3